MATILFSVPIEDAKGKARTFAFHTNQPAAATLGDIQTYLNGQLALIDAVTEGKILAANFTLSATLPGGLKAGAIADSDVEEGGLLSFVNTSPYVDSIRVPAWLQSLFSGATIPNLGATLALNNALINGVLVGANTFSGMDRYENDYTGFSAGKKSFRRK